ncbi:branched-chain amino acid transport system II carrier protein [Vibrio algivorus]|uniref:Branched-chain amino acid transport system carrier protein n=1 Tax=Vibrio algivorus TaxID=1667024 RepID=A0A557PDR0_9VIBR|nr:branched-chain amino acid transport system II carrier protein [Vibrio algivorus]TVO38805.1 branched-chain amino acid transport system II carrier protein [Vibrio algivorus]GLT16060.1 branched-chain amino acid transport system carrier protein [Vibrio algivorus]
MNQKLKITDIWALGFMLFAFFLGAGNIIFPPLAGQLAGESVFSTMLGFLSTAVGLPLLGIIAIALVGGGWDKLTQDLPKKAATIVAVLFFIIIGPAFAAPRTGLVAYEMGLKPFISEPSQIHLTIFSIVFFAIAMGFAWSQGKLLDVIGKVLTPVLFLGLIILSVMVFINPQGDIVAAQGRYATHAFSTGFLDGYNTMDTFASLMFGTLIIEALRSKKITDKRAVTRYVTYAAFIAAGGLALVYISLFYLGATSNSIAAGLDNGGAILSVYVQALFGTEGQFVLTTIVLLACLTTSIGLISACADYFSSLTPISYKAWVIVVGSVCALVANVGLTQLIALSVPVLFALYPVAIAIVFLTLVRSRLPNRALAYRFVVCLSLLFALIDAAKAVGIDMSALNFLPLFDYGMAWMLPTLAAVVVMMFVPKCEQQANEMAELSEDMA